MARSTSAARPGLLRERSPVDHVGRNPDVLAGVALRLEVGRIVVGQLHEQPSRLSDTVASDVPEDAVFLEALPRLLPSASA